MRKILEAIFVGIVFGLLTHIVGKVLPTEWRFLIETKAIWLIPAFLIAFNLPLRRKCTDAVIVSTVTLLTTGAVYYTSEAIKNTGGWYFYGDYGYFIIPAIIAGVITGYVAYLGRSATNDLIRYASVAILPAIYTGGGIEGVINTINNFEWTPEIATKLFGGFIFYILLTGKNKFKPLSVLAYVALALVAALGIKIT